MKTIDYCCETDVSKKERQSQQESDEPKTVVNHKVQEYSISPNQYPPSCHNVKQAPLSNKHPSSSLTFLIE